MGRKGKKKEGDGIGRETKENAGNMRKRRRG